MITYVHRYWVHEIWVIVFWVVAVSSTILNVVLIFNKPRFYLFLKLKASMIRTKIDLHRKRIKQFVGEYRPRQPLLIEYRS